MCRLCLDRSDSAYRFVFPGHRVPQYISYLSPTRNHSTVATAHTTAPPYNVKAHLDLCRLTRGDTPNRPDRGSRSTGRSSALGAWPRGDSDLEVLLLLSCWKIDSKLYTYPCWAHRLNRHLRGVRSHCLGC